ncbi:DUF2617 family protein [Mycobacterium sp. TNTM28]|uniref:DUF2617 family protein n=1 Tax=[Mycobacterium] fortunisiensis TaxID=2600579 RepID=A0ABS6KLE0_9MYCO|nr:DUF2617 family protein [[Mycobacterium] fortunisiensis]MBU9764402.1 DUF2617 family protein [[Mycobacterium] fortunisiensis]
MPLYQLAVAPADVSGTALRLTLNAPVPEPLARSRLRHPDRGVLTLGVLGASHVVTVDHPHAQFSEEVSCTEQVGGTHLPERADHAGYRLRSRIATLDEPGFRELATALRTSCALEPGWIGGTFPGDDAALTVLTAQPLPSGWRWRTWHLYPDQHGGTVVFTTSRWLP